MSIAYALPAEELAALAGRDFLIPCAELFARAEERVSALTAAAEPATDFD
jgi:hypothetical protein